MHKDNVMMRDMTVLRVWYASWCIRRAVPSLSSLYFDLPPPSLSLSLSLSQSISFPLSHSSLSLLPLPPLFFTHTCTMYIRRLSIMHASVCCRKQREGSLTSSQCQKTVLDSALILRLFHSSFFQTSSLSFLFCHYELLSFFLA